MNSIKKVVYGVAISLIFLSSNLFAQSGKETISENQKLTIINDAIGLLKANYIYPDRVLPIESVLKKKVKNKEYSSHNTVIDFTRAVTKDLEEIGKDHHLGIFYGPEWVSKIKAVNNSGANNLSANPQQFLDMINYDNFGLRKVERIEGNIGYFSFVRAEGLEYSKAAIVGAMNFISHSDAIIIDIRQNHGFSAEVVLFLESYFLPDSTKVGSFKRRVNNETVELYITKDPAVKKISESVPLFIVVDNKTSSGGEALAYDLQQFKRATIIGEQTLGEANPGRRFVINDQLWMMIPTATSMNAISGTNWEQVGVTPNIKTERSKTLQIAVLEASKSIVAKTRIPMQKQILKWQLPLLENEINPQSVTNQIISNLVGDYEGGAKIIEENQVVYYVNTRGKRKLNYIGNGIFQRDDDSELRLIMPFFDKPVNEVEWMWIDGGTEKMKRVVK